MSWEDETSTLHSAKALDDGLQEAIEKAVPWSKPSSRSNRWWTLEITQLKAKLANTKKLDRSNLAVPGSHMIVKKTYNKWREAIREAKWKHWDETFLESNRTSIHKAIKISRRNKSKKGLPDIQSMSKFQGKCGILREAVFPANVVIIPPLHPD